MSDRSERFFTWVWRVNGLLLLGLALLGGALAVVFAINIGIFALRERPERQLTEVAGTDLSAQDLRLADFQSIAGTEFLYAQLSAPSEYIGSGSSGGLGSPRNLLFFNTTSKKAHWLLSNNEKTIPSFSFLLDPPSRRYGYDDGEAHEQEQVAIALLVEIQAGTAHSASTGDRSLAIASADGRQLAKLVQSMQGLLGYHHARRDSLLVFYVSDGAARVLEVDPVARTVRSDAALVAQE